MQSRRTPFAQVVRPHMARLGALKNAGATEPRIAPRDFDAAEPFQLRATAYPGLPDAVCGLSAWRCSAAAGASCSIPGLDVNQVQLSDAAMVDVEGQRRTGRHAVVPYNGQTLKQGRARARASPPSWAMRTSAFWSTMAW